MPELHRSRSAEAANARFLEFVALNRRNLLLEYASQELIVSIRADYVIHVRYEHRPQAAAPPRPARQVPLWLKKVKAEEKGVVSCAICLEDLQFGSGECRELECSHKFHRKCLLRWLRQKLSCPVCRFQIPTATAAAAAASSSSSSSSGN